jgi:hypothetical protein
MSFLDILYDQSFFFLLGVSGFQFWLGVVEKPADFLGGEGFGNSE